MARKKPAPADQEAIEDTPTKPERIRLRNTRAGNGEIGGIATPLAKDADKWRAIGWVDAD